MYGNTTPKGWSAIILLFKRHNFYEKDGVTTIGSPESRVFILVALARVNASNWFNIMTVAKNRCEKQPIGFSYAVQKNDDTSGWVTPA